MDAVSPAAITVKKNKVKENAPEFSAAFSFFCLTAKGLAIFCSLVSNMFETHNVIRISQ